jgi:(E)-4-hydroxy-3-methylbut-2-enyl-diphosphate synthase
MRRESKKVLCRNVEIGGFAPITVQSMTNTKTSDAKATIAQIHKLEKVGCDIVRIAIPDMEAAEAIKEIKENTNIPLVADIHFDYRLALAAIENGIDKIRLNPGNIGSEERVKQVVDACKFKNIPIRIGVNSGSVGREILKKYEGKVTVDALIESAMEHVNILEKYNFDQIVVSIKASTTTMTIEANRKIAKLMPYPLHIGVTEAGTTYRGTIKSAVGIGTLLSEGIGDTIRVSLTGDVEEEVNVGKEILRSLGLLKDRIEIVSCPTCGRTRIDLVDIAEKVEEAIVKLDKCPKDIKIAIMGCAVNGPGEAREADIGIAGGDGCAVVFKKGEVIRKVKEAEIVEALMEELKKMI